MESDRAASDWFYFDIADGKFYFIDTDNEITDIITLTLRTAQIKGTVYKPDEVTPATGGIVRILDENANELRYFDILPNGTYSIGGLEPGNYFISAFPPFDPGYESVTMSKRSRL
jgi:hypothetical protein